ncbi:hypothetical protein HanRHA438_Chr07g0304541 [Helianthus annuus]|nr:hypothetical protein HanRHA438_Chr07g0304541 [Helianthus annuus]
MWISCRRRNPNRSERHRNLAKGRIKRRNQTNLVVSILTLIGRRTRNSRWFGRGSFRRTPMLQIFKPDPNFGIGFVHSFIARGGKGEHRDKDSISGKWIDINNKCHAFQEVYQRNYDNRPSGEGDVELNGRKRHPPLTLKHQLPMPTTSI